MKSSTLMTFIIILVVAITSCDNNIALKPLEESPVNLDSTNLRGTGSFVFTEHLPLNNKPVNVFYHVPESATSQTPILFLFHGGDRSGKDTRNALISSANSLNFIIIAPEFSSQYYPGGDQYNLANIFEDGDNPSASTLNNEGEWTLSIIEPLFDHFKQKTGSTVSTYDILGHSAGAQFAHRFIIFKPLARYRKVIAAASGWYTMLDDSIDFPYGTLASPAENADHTALLAKQVYILIGENDDDENSSGLRHNSVVDKQGLNRYTRAQHFYTSSQDLAKSLSVSFNWTYLSVPNLNHNYGPIAEEGVRILYK